MSAALIESVSALIWKNVGLYHRYGVSYGEDAITSALLVAIAEASPRNLLLKDTRPSESTKGCDFDLWIGGHRLGWYRYAVQAKKISVSTEYYRALNHMVGSAKVPQIDILDRYASRNAATPLYCFYNFVDRPIGREWHCPLPKDEEQLGCTVTPSSVVRAALSTKGRRNFSAIHDDYRTVPFRCLWRCPEVLPQGAAHAAPHDRLFGQQVWFEALPDPIQEAIQRREEASFEHLIERGVFNTGPERLLPRFLAVLDVTEPEPSEPAGPQSAGRDQ